MQDKELYYKLLGLEEPWQIKEVNVDFSKQRVDVWIEWPEGEKAPCPECGQECSIYDHRDSRRWRHLDTMQFSTYLHCAIPRVNCSDHEAQTIDVPWSEPHSRFTLQFERLAIDMLLACEKIEQASGLLGISWYQLHRIQKRAVGRGKQREEQAQVDYIGVDEKSFLKNHEYATLLYDLDNNRVLEMSRDRTSDSLEELLEKLSDRQREAIDGVALDIWPPYRKAIKEQLPDAQIVHDKFHISTYLNKMVDQVRRKERKEREELKGTRYIWLQRPDHWDWHYLRQYRELKELNLKTARAWAIKEQFSHFWTYKYPKAAANFFKRWYWWATHSRLEPVRKIAKRLKKYFEDIISYLEHRITNAVAEGLNSKVQQIKASARGFRNFGNFRIAVLFYCGKLDMYPQKT